MVLTKCCKDIDSIRNFSFVFVNTKLISKILNNLDKSKGTH